MADRALGNAGCGMDVANLISLSYETMSNSSNAKRPAEQVVKDIRRATRLHFSAEDKIRIVAR